MSASEQLPVSGEDGQEPTAEAPLAWRVVGGGDPTPEQLAVLAVALLPSGGGGGDSADDWSAWQQAALAEGVGGRPAYAATDVDRIRYLRPNPG